VLFNLIQNAIRHTPADGSVTVRAASAGSSVEIEVADTGAGSRPTIASASSSRFSRASIARRGPTQRRPGPRDLRAIVEAHGGRIWIVKDSGAQADSGRGALQPAGRDPVAARGLSRPDALGGTPGVARSPEPPGQP